MTNFSGRAVTPALSSEESVKAAIRDHRAGAFKRTLIRLSFVVPPMFIAPAFPMAGSAIQILPVLIGVLICVRQAVQGGLRDGWLAEI